MHPNTLDHVALWVADRDAIAARDADLSAREMADHVSYTASVVQTQIDIAGQ